MFDQEMYGGLGASDACACDGSDDPANFFCGAICGQGGSTGNWVTVPNPTPSGGSDGWSNAGKFVGGVAATFGCKLWSAMCPSYVGLPGGGYLINQPWYATTGGQVGIVAGVLLLGVGGYYALKK